MEGFKLTQFNFRFQKILDLKENEKGFAQIQMAEAMKQHEVGHQQNRVIQKKINDAEQLRNAKQQSGVNISELRMLEDYIYQLQGQSLSSERELENLQKKVSASQGVLQEKAKEEKTWENLKQQKLTHFQEEKKAAEQSFFDEMASTRFYRLAKANNLAEGI
ncbi:flagellar export protein FliJ [Planococcus halocryophilus]|uniref:flagellar export protein FliJ n=1 Tax=Planococcus halocryophilus TaxID=1215089 RepID=UPI0023EA78BC|nr:flagellar export protein FliJ [Planococcus halocryophilus]